MRALLVLWGEGILPPELRRRSKHMLTERIRLGRKVNLRKRKNAERGKRILPWVTTQWFTIEFAECSKLAIIDALPPDCQLLFPCKDRGETRGKGRKRGIASCISGPVLGQQLTHAAREKPLSVPDNLASWLESEARASAITGTAYSVLSPCGPQETYIDGIDVGNEPAYKSKRDAVKQAYAADGAKLYADAVNRPRVDDRLTVEDRRASDAMYKPVWSNGGSVIDPSPNHVKPEIPHSQRTMGQWLSEYRQWQNHMQANGSGI